MSFRHEVHVAVRGGPTSHHAAPVVVVVLPPAASDSPRDLVSLPGCTNTHVHLLFVEIYH